MVIRLMQRSLVGDVRVVFKPKLNNEEPLERLILSTTIVYEKVVCNGFKEINFAEKN